MQQAPIDPLAIFTQAMVSSAIAGMVTFASTIVSNIFVRPMVSAISQNLTTLIEGGMKSFINADAPPPSFFDFTKIPAPPFFFSVTPEGNINLSIPVGKAMEQFMPLFYPINKEE